MFRVIIVIVIVTAIVIGVLYAIPLSQDRLGIEHDILKLINEERESRGLALITWSEELHEGARSHSELLAEKGTVFHATGSFSECIYYDSHSILFFRIPSYPNAKTVVQSWMDSYDHRSILLDKRSRYGAVGIAKGSFGTGGGYATYRCR